MEKLTDNEIIKALKRCINGTEKCNLCPMFENCKTDINALEKHTLDLINRLKVESKGYRYKAQTQKGELARLYKQNAEQKAEIERLKKVIETMTNEQLQFGFEAKSKIKQAKAEAIKEFAAKAKVYAYYIDYPTIHRVIDEEDIDNLVKEMVGDAE